VERTRLASVGIYLGRMFLKHNFLLLWARAKFPWDMPLPDASLIQRPSLGPVLPGTTRDLSR
jgi:hypothetical protein